MLLDNMQHLANHIVGKQAVLKFNVPLAKIRRNDSLEVQQRILTMTPAERNALDLSKSGLRYQKKKIVEGKPVKIYGKVQKMS